MLSSVIQSSYKTPQTLQNRSLTKHEADIILHIAVTWSRPGHHLEVHDKLHWSTIHSFIQFNVLYTYKQYWNRKNREQRPGSDTESPAIHRCPQRCGCPLLQNTKRTLVPHPSGLDQSHPAWPKPPRPWSRLLSSRFLYIYIFGL